MKKVTVLIFLLIINLSLSQDLKGKVTYQASLNSEDFLTRLEKNTSLDKQRKDYQLKNVSTSSEMNFHLLFRDDESLFQAEYDLITKRNLGYKYNRTGEMAQDDRIYYTNLKTKENFYQSFWTKEVLVENEEINWVLSQETKKIGNQICYKATATIATEQLEELNFMSPVIAWYTPEIPVPFGIQRFNGLPGLILELVADYQGGKVFFKATKIELNTKEEIKIKKPKGKKVSEQEYIKLIDKLNRARQSKAN